MHTPEQIDAAAGQIVSLLDQDDEASAKQAVVTCIGIISTFVKAQVRQANALERIAFELELRREQGR